jgi:hypothetical protein
VKIFWSWQSDTPQSIGKLFVRDALLEVVRDLAEDTDLQPAERPDAVDHDTLDVPGSPQIASTILEKIERCAVFVADITPVGQTQAGKRLPNPNVLIELGYALKCLGLERIILVMNTYQGASLKHLPFDLRHWRAPITYNLAPDKEDHRHESSSKLMEELRSRLLPCLKAAALKAKSAKEASAQPQLGKGTSSTNLALWEDLGATVFATPISVLGAPQELIVPNSPSIYCRIIPEKPYKARRTQIAPRNSQEIHFAPIGGGGFETGTNEAGAISWSTTYNRQELHSVCQWFQDTGEFWAIFFGAIVEHAGTRTFIGLDAVAATRTFLRIHSRTLLNAGSTGPWRVQAGATKIKGSAMYVGRDTFRPTLAVADQFSVEFTFLSWSENEFDEYVNLFAQEMFDCYATECPSEDQLLALIKDSRYNYL